MDRKLMVFLVVMVGVGALLALTWWATGLPPCEDPPNSWSPCVGSP